LIGRCPHLVGRNRINFRGHFISVSVEHRKKVPSREKVPGSVWHGSTIWSEPKSAANKKPPRDPERRSFCRPRLTNSVQNESVRFSSPRGLLIFRPIFRASCPEHATQVNRLPETLNLPSICRTFLDGSPVVLGNNRRAIAEW